MCRCTFAAATYNQLYILTGIVTVISAFPVAAATLFSFLDPFMQYTQNYEVGILGGISFLLIFVGGFMGLQGVCDGKQCCINSMISMKIISAVFLFSLSAAILRIRDIYMPDNTLSGTCT